MNKFKIFPSIGIARLGNSPTGFYLCAEKPDSLGIETDSAGNETELSLFKDPSGLLKKQGARFTVYQLNVTGNDYLPLADPTASINWEVYLVNKKAGVVRPANPDDAFPQVPLPLNPNSAALTIDPGKRKISGKNQSGVKFDTGKFQVMDSGGVTHTDTVFLGELRTDINGNLIVLGGNGISKSPLGKPLSGLFYFSDGWYDDVSDGYVKATVTVGGVATEAVSAWVIIAPPDYAPAVKAVVTLYDIIEQVAKDHNGWKTPAQPSFVNDILPIIDRFKNLSWVNDESPYSVPFTYQVLSDNGPASQAKRNQVAGNIKQIRNILKGDLPGSFLLTDYQLEKLSNWVSGNFINDFSAPTPTSLKSSDLLNKTVLDSTVGQRFVPGIEGGIIMQNPNIYSEPFRVDIAKLSPGDITALMALPWQGDFFDCATNWWPSQRPDKVKTLGGVQQWSRKLTNAQDLINNYTRIGIVKPQKDAGGSVQQIEMERDPAF